MGDKLGKAWAMIARFNLPPTVCHNQFMVCLRCHRIDPPKRHM